MNDQQSAFSNLQFLKLGGSLITDKSQPYTARPKVIERIAGEVAAFRQAHPDQHVLLGHGSGSFGHRAAQEHGTRQGVYTAEQWQGFVEVWTQAASLNRIVMDALYEAGLPAIAFPPSAGAQARSGQLQAWEPAPIQAALEAGLLPVVYGDVAFDEEQGGAILSTEDLFAYLAPRLQPDRLLLAGDQAGIYGDYPENKDLIAEVTPKNVTRIASALSGAENADVTGGMLGKVGAILGLIEQQPQLAARIFSGQEPGAIGEALAGKPLGTLLHSG